MQSRDDVQNLLKEEVTRLGLSSGTLLRLWDIEIESVGELTVRSPSDLRQALGAGSDANRMVHEVTERLLHFGLRLQPNKNTKRKAVFTALNGHLPTDEVLESFLGDQVGLFKDYWLAQDEDHRITARNRIVVRNKGLIWKIAWKSKYLLDQIGDPMMDLEDLRQTGVYGLIRAIALYDPAKQNTFSTYAYSWISMTISRSIEDALVIPNWLYHELRKKLRGKGIKTLDQDLSSASEQMRELVLEEKEDVGDLDQYLVFLHHPTSLYAPLGEGDSGEPYTLEDILADERDSPEEVCERIQIQRKLVELLARIPLSEVERTMLSMHHGLGGYEPHTLEAIGDYYNLSRERVRQIISNATALIGAFPEAATQHRQLDE